MTVDISETQTASSDTRTLVVRTARKLMLTHSYLGLNLQEVADLVGIRKASLYYHFPSKQALGEAVVEDSSRLFSLWTESLAGEPAEQQLRAYVSMVRDTLGAGMRVCLIGATASEWDRVEPEVQSAVGVFHRIQFEWIEQVAQRLKYLPSGEAPDANQPSGRQWAAHITALCRGALLNARLSNDPTLYDLAVEPLLARLAALT